MLYLTAALTLVWVALIGIKEGMVMIHAHDKRGGKRTYITEGIRCHVWYKYYHMKFAQSIFRALPVLIGFLLARLDWTAFTVFFLAGIVFLGWQALESFYSWTRYATWLPESENLMGIWRIDWAVLVLLITAMRIYLGILLIIGAFLV